MNEVSQDAAEGGRLVSRVSCVTKRNWLAVRQETPGYSKGNGLSLGYGKGAFVRVLLSGWASVSESIQLDIGYA